MAKKEKALTPQDLKYELRAINTLREAAFILSRDLDLNDMEQAMTIKAINDKANELQKAHMENCKKWAAEWARAMDMEITSGMQLIEICNLAGIIL